MFSSDSVTNEEQSLRLFFFQKGFQAIEPIVHHFVELLWFIGLRAIVGPIRNEKQAFGLGINDKTRKFVFPRAEVLLVDVHTNTDCTFDCLS